MDDIERLVATEEIRKQIARYALAFDDHNWDDFATLWSEDASFVADGIAFEGRDRLLEFLSTCLPDDYLGKHMNSPSLIEIDPSGIAATAKTDVVWITQNFENTIVARYDDTFLKQDGNWVFTRREESSIEFRPGPPPMSASAKAVSGATIRK